MAEVHDHVMFAFAESKERPGTSSMVVGVTGIGAEALANGIMLTLVVPPNVSRVTSVLIFAGETMEEVKAKFKETGLPFVNIPPGGRPS